MAEQDSGQERTEDPSGKRLDEAREKGQVPRSQELSTVVVLISSAVAMLFVSFIFLSIEDIAVQIEEPFAILPLELQHKWLMRDSDEMRTLMRWYEGASKRQRRSPEAVDRETG